MKTLKLLLGIVLSFGFLSHALADQHGMATTYTASLIPLNNSGVYAQVEVSLMNGRELMVSINASGLEPGKPHPQHIHGFNKPVTNSTCPTLEADTDGDGLISVTEGVPSFGPIILPLMPFNLVDDNGNLSYTANFPVRLGDLQPLHKRAVVIHGLTVNGSYIPSLPVACGELEVM